MKTDPSYVSLTISATADPTELPPKITELLGRTIKRPPEDIPALLNNGPITMAKVVVNSDLDRLITFLERRGLQVSVAPFARESPGLSSIRFPSRTMGGDLNPQSDQARIDWKEGEIIEGLYEVLGSAPVVWERSISSSTVYGK